MKFLKELLEGSKQYRKLRQARKHDTKANRRILKKLDDTKNLPAHLQPQSGVEDRRKRNLSDAEKQELRKEKNWPAMLRRQDDGFSK